MKAANEFIGEMAENISMPDVYMDIRQLIEQHDANIKDFVDVIQNDSMLSVRLNRIANSRYFGFPRRAESLHQAISLIGIMQLHDLMLNSLSIRTFSSIPEQIFNLEAFWKYSVECGIAARTIAQHSQMIPINPYFTFGLLHEIGHAAMFVKAPELYVQVLDETRVEDGSLIDKERELLGFDYTQAGTALIKLWQLPEIYQQVTAFHLHPEKAHKTHRQTVKIIHLAHMICQNPTPGQHLQLIEKIKLNDHQLSRIPSNIDQIIFKEVEANTDSILRMLWPSCTQELEPVVGWEIHE